MSCRRALTPSPDTERRPCPPSDPPPSDPGPASGRPLLRTPLPLGTPVPGYVPLPSPAVDAERLRMQHELDALEGATWLIKDCATVACAVRMLEKAIANRRTRLSLLPKGIL